MLSELLLQFKAVDVNKMRARNFLAVQDEIEKTKLNGIEAGSGWKEVGACPICRSTGRRHALTKHNIDMVECTECSVRYGAKIPANLADVYANPKYLSYSLPDTDEHYSYRRERFGKERVGILAKHCGELSTKKLLDVGCGNGFFLSAATERVGKCFGTEFSGRLRAEAERRTGCRIFSETLDKIPERDFDIVTLFDVIEHLPDPVGFFRQVDALVKPGGHILVFTPNFDSFGIRVMGHYSSIVDPTEHIVLFTEKSLRRLGDQLGYEVVYAETQGMDAINILSMQDFLKQERDPWLVQWNNELQAMINKAGCGDYGRIMYRKRL